MSFQGVGTFAGNIAIALRNLGIIGNAPMQGDNLPLLVSRKLGQALGLFAVLLLLLWRHRNALSPYQFPRGRRVGGGGVGFSARGGLAVSSLAEFRQLSCKEPTHPSQNA